MNCLVNTGFVPVKTYLLIACNKASYTLMCFIFQVFISDLFECLFALPSPVKRYLPKCKSQSSRSGAYDLLIEIVKGNMDNYKVLHAKMLHQHTKGIDTKKDGRCAIFYPFLC